MVETETVTGQITSREELQNIIVMGLDLWVANTQTQYADPWKLTKPKLSIGPRGPMLGSPIVEPNYLRRWGIHDHGNHHTVYIFGHSNRLFCSKEDAVAWRRKKGLK